MWRSRGPSGTWPVSQEAPHTLFRSCQPVLGPFTWTDWMDPLLAASYRPSTLYEMDTPWCNLHCVRAGSSCPGSAILQHRCVHIS